MWIQEYREREKPELWQFQQRVNTYVKYMDNPLEACISAQLIHMLEVDKNAVTHPRIANAIATLCGATSDQRDMIVADKHKKKGEWVPSDKDKSLADRVNRKYDFEQKGGVGNKSFNDLMDEEVKSVANNARQVVAIDVSGNTIGRYYSVKYAAEICGTSPDLIRNRCHRSTKMTFVHPYGSKFGTKNGVTCTFRYADEWDKMTDDEKAADIKNHWRSRQHDDGVTETSTSIESGKFNA